MGKNVAIKMRAVQKEIGDRQEGIDMGELRGSTVTY